MEPIPAEDAHKVRKRCQRLIVCAMRWMRYADQRSSIGGHTFQLREGVYALSVASCFRQAKDRGFSLCQYQSGTGYPWLADWKRGCQSTLRPRRIQSKQGAHAGQRGCHANAADAESPPVQNSAAVRIRAYERTWCRRLRAAYHIAESMVN